MKIAIALACLLAIATAVEETKKVDQIGDLEAAENRYSGGGQHRGGHGGGHHRTGRSIEEDQPLVLEEIQPIVESVSDLELSENRYGGGYGGGRRGGHGGRHGGYHNRRGRSIEEDQPLVLEEIQPIVDSVSDLELAENAYGGGYGSRGYGGYGGGHHGGYGGGYRNRGGWGRRRRSVEDLEAAENRRGGYSGGAGYRHSLGYGNYGNSGYNRPSSGYGGSFGHGHGRY